MTQTIRTEVLVIGGGAAGLWLLDRLRREGRPALLLEKSALGAGQTVASQGIIHGGLKYTLAGLFTDSARTIRDMPNRWRNCLRGQGLPDLRTARVRAEFCHLWRTGSIRSRAGMIGARAGLRTRPIRLKREDWPEALSQCGDVYRLDEQVLAPASLMAALASPHRDRILLAPDVSFDDQGVAIACHGRTLRILPGVTVLTAGQGNEALLKLAGLTGPVMQRRPLHMVLARGPLPVLNGHCTDTARTRITITTDTDAAGRTIWQIGGQVSEDGVAMDESALIAHAKAEVAACVPGLDLAGAQWATYRVDRAEPATPGNKRPDDAFARRDGRVITAWPTKLALVPHLVDMTMRLLPPAGDAANDTAPPDWPRPSVADPPWETVTHWRD